MSKSTVTWDDCAMTVEYMGPAEIAAFVSREFGVRIAASTIRNYASDGRLPAPDVRIGPNGGWSEESIREWWKSRPGRGARTDLQR
ncbi:helix-turn-helix transcriptional regulator [Microbacterium sp. YY-01]|uniref:helix-turn-helix transcriptional regulator n=1 Tax=Microbacterium sp. YY-01 TaxID=3421634 RepID=UPI003D1793FA